jgi:hypothetical protein
MVPTSQFVFPGSYAPDAPNDMFSGIGSNGQLLSISKSLGLVFVRMGNQAGGGEVPFQLCNSIWQKLNAVMCNTNSINESNELNKSISIYPNPATSEINLVLPSENNYQIEIKNSIGQLIIKDQNKNKIDISNLINGIYFISVKQGHKYFYHKFIKQ